MKILITIVGLALALGFFMGSVIRSRHMLPEDDRRASVFSAYAACLTLGFLIYIWTTP